MQSAADQPARRRGPAVKAKGPGRPEGVSRIRDDILDAAERLFADLGYAGTTLREVSQAAKVTQALINYYFGSKSGLFGEVFLRRAAPVSAQRLETLASLRAAGTPLNLEAIVRAFLAPSLRLRATRQGRAFLRLQARLHTEPPHLSYALRQSAYDASTKAYIAALREVQPELSELEAHWRITLMIGTYLYAFSDTHRLEDLTEPGLYDPDDTEAMFETVTRFIVGGMQR
ncbi:TetR/AcrR family transcriptional regulator [Arboricoccus pini]|nr:TetR/AcrR family transcriptional regulator [Arboricoccus pini]